MNSSITSYNMQKAQMLMKSFKIDLFAAIAVTFNDKKQVLLGLSKATDDRKDKWCFPGGKIDGVEHPIQAALRELYEETGQSGTPLTTSYLVRPEKPNVAYVFIKTNTEVPFNMCKKEFSKMEWFDLDKLPDNTMAINKDIIKNNVEL